MPEGPSIVILKEALIPFRNKKVLIAGGDAAIDLSRLEGQKIIDLKSWGKHLLICFKHFFIRIHLMMFGTYRISGHKDSVPRLHLGFKGDEVNFYTCQVALIEKRVEEVYNWETDIMSGLWNAHKAELTLTGLPRVKICDALLDQDIFSGVGNIIKNESLFNSRLHPETETGHIPTRKLRELLAKTQKYTWDFYTWKQEGTLAQHWRAYEQKICPRCRIPFEKEYLGKNKRISFFCNTCQINYNPS